MTRGGLLGLLIAFSYSAGNVLPASGQGQRWHVAPSTGSGEVYLFSTVLAALTGGAEKVPPHATLLLRCGGDQSTLPFFQSPVLEDSVPYVLRRACEEGHDFCSEQAIPFRMSVGTKDGQSIVYADTAGIREISYMYPRDDAQRDRWLHWLDTGSELELGFDWYKGDSLKWKWSLRQYASTREKKCR